MRDKRSTRKPTGALERRQAVGSDPRVVGDPITLGLDKSIHIDLTKLTAPTNQYDADWAWLEHRPGEVALFFAKGSRDDEQRLRTRLELRYPPENMVNHFWRNSRSFHSRLRDYLGQWPHRDAPPVVRQWKSQKDHSEWVNFETMAHAGTEGTIDFYSLSVPGLARFRQGQGSASLRIFPVVRVQLSAFELLRFLDAAETVVREIESYLPKRDSADAEAVEAVPEDEGEV